MHPRWTGTQRRPIGWAKVAAHPVPDWTLDPEVVGKALSGLGQGVGPAIIACARQTGVPLPPEVDQTGELPPGLIVSVLRQISGRFFPLLGGVRVSLSPRPHQAKKRLIASVSSENAHRSAILPSRMW